MASYILQIAQEFPMGILLKKKYLFMHFTDFTHTEDLYLAGRTTAKQYLPQLWQLLARKQEEQVKVKEKLHSLFNE